MSKADQSFKLASSFSGIQRASWEATCAPDDDVSVPQPQHLSTNNNYPPSSEWPIKKKRCRNGMQEAPRVVGQVGMPNPAPRPRRTIKKKADMEANRRKVSGAISRVIEG
ncbi:Carnitine monooxygenase oxygenase subunit [Fusarium oxysporum f. sp. albedinis]|nr:Carnitine monooxygenase oxygenase subunit [Fusarium oxysporum f. sp. albedinis]